MWNLRRRDVVGVSVTHIKRKCNRNVFGNRNATAHQLYNHVYLENVYNYIIRRIWFLFFLSENFNTVGSVVMCDAIDASRNRKT